MTYLNFDGAILEQHEPPREWHKNSLRHIAVRKDGCVAIACQWEGGLGQTPPLIATHRRGQPLAFHRIGKGVERDMQGYVGSIAFSANGKRLAATAPRGGMAVLMDARGNLRHRLMHADICGVAAAEDGFVFTTGSGQVLSSARPGRRELASHACNWDNHLAALA